MSNIWTIEFLKATAERVLFTALQVLAALMAAGGFGLADLTTGATWSIVGMAAAAALVKAVLAGLGNGNPSVFNEEILATPAVKAAVVEAGPPASDAVTEDVYVKDVSPKG